jgi:predicted nicotinamide N-methyase
MRASESCVSAIGRRRRLDIVEFIKANMPIAPASALPEILIHAAHPASGLRRLSNANDRDRPPYWAYPWPGGAALARYFLDRPKTVLGRRVLDLGAGAGVVGIAAAKAGARDVVAAEIDRNAIEALRLNAAANGVEIGIVTHDVTGAEPLEVDLVAAGDVFYDRDLAARVTAFLDRCLDAGIEVLVGDPGRAFLPRGRLRLLAEYPVRDFGSATNAASTMSGVFSYF